MRVFKLFFCRSKRAGLTVLIVTISIYVILTYTASYDATKRSGYLWALETSRATVTESTEDNPTWKGGGNNDTITGHTDPPIVVDKETVTNYSRLLQSGAVLLAGNPRNHSVEFTVGFVTVAREKGSYFFDTLSYLLSRCGPENRKDLTIVVMLADRKLEHNAGLFSDIKIKYPKELNEGLLLVIRGAKTEFLFENHDLKRTYNDSLMRVQWRSKQNLDYAALIEFCANLSTYYIHIEDDVIAAQDYVRHIRDFIRENAKKIWAVLEVSPHGFIGKLFRNADLPKMVMILRTFYLEQPCDFLLPNFLKMMTQNKPIVRKASLFFHQGQYSSLRNVTRKVDRLPGADKNGKAVTVLKMHTTHKNPQASLFTNMAVYKEHDVIGAYDPQVKQFFWASDLKPGHCVSVLFDTPQRLEKLIVETGLDKGKDKLQKGSLEVGTELPKFDKDTRCPNTKKIGDFKNGRFEAPVTSETPIRCINIVVNAQQTEWLVISEILVFVRKE